MVRVNGRKIIYLIAISMRVNIIWIRSMDLEFSNGKLAMFIEEIIKMI